MSSTNYKRRSVSRSRSRSRSREIKDKYKNQNQNHNQTENFREKDKDRNSQQRQNWRKPSDEGVKLYLSNLGPNISDKRVLEEFKNYGEVLDISIKRKNGRSNFFGYVLMKNKNAGELAMAQINKNLGWKITLYERDNRWDNNRHREDSESLSLSNSKSPSRKNTWQDDERKHNASNNTTNETEKKPFPEEFNNKPVRVREIWVGNLPSSITEQMLYNQFFIFGEIARMETHFQSDRNFAFIKYRSASCASRAYEKGKNMNLNGNIIRVSFSDSGKRKDIIGDEAGYELNEKTCKMLHISLNRNSPVAHENVLKDLFRKYGNVKGMHIKNQMGFRPTVYVEYSKAEEAENALSNLVALDTNFERRKLIGDANCDINYYFKKKMMMNTNNMSYNMQHDGNAHNNLNMNNMVNRNTRPIPGQNMGMMNPYAMQNPQLMQQYYMMQRQMMAKNANMNNIANINNMNNPNTNMNVTNPAMNQNMAMANMNTNLHANSAMNSNANLAMNMNSNKTALNSNLNHNQSTGEMNQNMYNMSNNFQNKNPQNFPYGMNNISSVNVPNNNQMSSTQQQQPTPTQTNPNNMTIPPMMPRYPYPMMNTINPMNPMNPMRPMMYPNNPMLNPMMNQMYQQPSQTNTNNQSQNSSQNIKDMINEAISKLMSPNNTNNNEDDNDLSSINDDTHSNFEKDFSLEEENLKNIWGGFLTKNKKDRVCVDAYQIRNECSEFLNNEYNLNVSHRTQADDIVKRPIIGITAFSPQNATQCDIFQDYINYFNEKNRVGVINLKNQMILYLVPPCEFSRKFYQNPKKHLLGVFVNSTAEPKSYVDLNNLSLPPPVISLTEKRQLLKQQKKNSSGNKVEVSNANQIGENSQEAMGELTKLLGNLEQDKLELLLKAASELNSNSANSNLNSHNSNNPNVNDLSDLMSSPQFKNILSQLNLLNK